MPPPPPPPSPSKKKRKKEREEVRSRTHISSVSGSRFGSVIAPSKKTASSRSNRLLLPAGTLEDEKVKVCVSKSEKKGSVLLSKVNRLNLVAKFIRWLLKNGEKHEKIKK